MEDERKVPKIMELLFGGAAETAQRGASERLRRWCEAFEEWLEDRKLNYKPGAYKQALMTWRRFWTKNVQNKELLGEPWTLENASRASSNRQGKRRKMPWELEQGDIEQHAAWMEGEGYAPTTIYNAVGVMASFYRWCGERGVDPECGAGFNPAAGVRRPKIRRYAGASLLSRGEVEALLGTLRRDETPLGKRDYAFFVTRLSLGAPLSNLRRLRWGQIEQGEKGAAVRWRPEGGLVELPGEAWEAMRAWLAASGRLVPALPGGMRVGAFVFTPLAYPGKAETGDKAEHWHEDWPLSSDAILADLKLYGRLAGIAEEKLTLMALRRTAVRLRMEAGDGLEDGDKLVELQAFLDSEEEPKFTRYRLKRLPTLPQDPGRVEKGNEPALPVRKARPFQEGEGMTHGLYAHSQPAQEVMAVLEENIQGIEEEIAGLRTLARGLLDWQGKARSSKEMGQLVEAYTLSAARLAGMIEAEKQMAKRGKADPQEEELQTSLEEFMKGMGTEDARVEGRGDPLELTTAARRLVEEIAGMRCVLRRTLGLAREAEQRRDPWEYIHLTEIYSNGCNRLMRLLRVEGAGRERLAAYLKETIEMALRVVHEEMGIRG